MNKLHGSKSFYGYSYSLMKHSELDRKECQMDETDLVDSNETLCSLLVSLLPPIDYHYQFGCEVEDCVPNDIEDKKLKLLITVVKALRTKASLNIPKVHPSICSFIHVSIRQSFIYSLMTALNTMWLEYLVGTIFGRLDTKQSW